MAKITVALMKELEKQLGHGEISYSRMVEILNEQSKLNGSVLFEYYKVKSEYTSWKGERFFKFKWDASKITQVCLEVKK